MRTAVLLGDAFLCLALPVDAPSALCAVSGAAGCCVVGEQPRDPKRVPGGLARAQGRKGGKGGLRVSLWGRRRVGVPEVGAVVTHLTLSGVGGGSGVLRACGQGGGG